MTDIEQEIFDTKQKIAAYLLRANKWCDDADKQGIKCDCYKTICVAASGALKVFDIAAINYFWGNTLLDVQGLPPMTPEILLSGLKKMLNALPALGKIVDNGENHVYCGGSHAPKKESKEGETPPQGGYLN
jgi:hypothetical protein